jgi:hypothetical protein
MRTTTLNNKRLTSEANKADPRLREAVGEIIRRISAQLPTLPKPIRMYLAGGMAVHFYTGYRSTVDVDASFSHRLLLPKAEDLVVAYKGADGKPRMIYFDVNYNSSFALTHPDFEKDALRAEGSEFADSKIDLHILSPIDLALAKVSRFERNDREDIAELARRNLIDAQELAKRAAEAVEYYVGNSNLLQINLKEAADIIRASQGLLE